jgi:hypothetical protein
MSGTVTRSWARSHLIARNVCQQRSDAAVPTGRTPAPSLDMICMRGATSPGSLHGLTGPHRKPRRGATRGVHECAAMKPW